MISLFQMNVCLAVFTTTVAILALGLLIYVLINNHVHAEPISKDVENPNNSQIYKPKTSAEVIDIEDKGFPRMRSERALKDADQKESVKQQQEVVAANLINEAQYDDPIVESHEADKSPEASTIEPPFVKRIVEPECSPNTENESSTRC